MWIALVAFLGTCLLAILAAVAASYPGFLPDAVLPAQEKGHLLQIFAVMWGLGQLSLLGCGYLGFPLLRGWFQ